MKTRMTSKFVAVTTALLLFAASGTVLGSCSGDTIIIGGSGPLVTLYAADGHRGGTAGFLYRITSHGAIQIVGPIVTAGGLHLPVGSMAFGPDGKLYATSSSGENNWSTASNPINPAQLFTINTSTGEATIIGDLVDGGMNTYAATGLAFDDNGDLFGMTGDSDFTNGSELIEINPATGAVTFVGGGAGSFGNALAFDKANDRMLLAANGVAPGTNGGSNGNLDTINTTTGAPTTLVVMQGPLSENGSSGRTVNSMTFAGGHLFGVIGSWDNEPLTLAHIDPETGEVNVTAQIPPLIHAIAAR